MRLDDELLRAAKRRAIDRGVTLTKVIEDALRADLAREPTRPEEPIRLTTFRGRGGLRPGVNLDDGAALRDLLDGF